MRHRSGTAVACAAVALALIGLPTDADAATRPIGQLTPATGAWFGALVNPDRTNPSSTPGEVAQLEAQIGRKLDIVNYFYTYNQPIGTQGEVQAIASGQLPMVTWGATSTTAINDGSQDAYIKAQAVRLRDLGKPVFLRYFHEPEGTYRTSIVTSPAAYVAAWLRARELFASVGATNVVWVFCQTTFSFRNSKTLNPTAYYPGDANVDWIAADGYNFAPNKTGSVWTSFQTLFQPFYSWAATRPKPMMVAEYGAMEDPSQPERRAQWYKDMQASVKGAFPLMQAVVVWDTVNVKDGATFDWRPTSSGEALAAWASFAHDPYFDPLGR